MSNTYEDEMFAFFTSNEDTFTNLCAIQKHYVPVRTRLLQSFWDAVRDALERNAPNGWKAVRVGHGMGRHDKVAISKPEWGITEDCPSLGVVVEDLWTKPGYGPYVHNREATLDIAKANEYLRKSPIIGRDGFVDDGSWWFPFWAECGFSLASDDDLLTILPVKQTNLAEQTAVRMTSLARELESDLDWIHTSCRR